METRPLSALGARLLAVLLGGVIWPLAALAQPVTDIGVDAVFDFDADGETDATYEHTSVNTTQGNEPYYTVGFFLRNTPHLRFVRASAQRIDLRPADVVSLSNPVYVNPGEGNSVGLLAYDAEQIFGQWTFYNTAQGNSHAFFLGKTEVLVGFRLTSLEAGTKHHGWIRFTRPDSHFTTPFAVAGYDWNPLPNEPIAAGGPPAIPLISQVTAEKMLHLTWPAAVTGWILETSDTLGPGAVWQPVDDVAGNEAVLPPPATNRFFRLRRP